MDTGSCNQERVRIDVDAIPDGEMQVICAVLNRSIRLALSDPKKRADFEAWKERRRQRREMEGAEAQAEKKEAAPLAPVRPQAKTPNTKLSP